MPPDNSSTGKRSPKRAKKPWTAIKKALPTTSSGERDIFWHPAMSTPPPPNYTPGLVPVLKACLAVSHSRGDIRKAALCYDQAVYIQREFWDATWGCGYRNFLMACAVLMVQPLQPLYFPLIDEPIPPGIRNLQQWIEIAWDSGFDPEGKAQLKKLLGTRKWIGTSDIWVAFSSRGIPAELVDFENTKKTGVQPLTEWTVKYFTPAQPSSSNSPRNAFDVLKGSNAVISTEKMPFILQHEGHSRLIVGYEIDKLGKVNLLTFDCGHPLPKSLREYAISKLPSRSISEPAGEASHKRRASGSLSGVDSIKRSRSDADLDSEVEIVAERNINTPTLDDDIVITGFTSPTKRASTSASSLKSSVSPRNIDLKLFKISPKALGTKKKYQILYFPMTAPLTDSERLESRTPTSTKVC